MWTFYYAKQMDYPIYAAVMSSLAEDRAHTTNYRMLA